MPDFLCLTAGECANIPESITEPMLILLTPRLRSTGKEMCFVSDDLPFTQTGSALLFHLLSKMYERTRVVISTNLSFLEWANVFGGPRMTTALLD